jgi:hypothetical protein
MLQAGRYLDQTRLAGETLLSVNRLLAESRLRVAWKPYALKRTRTALKSILIFGDETTPSRRAKRAREYDRCE